MNSHNLVILLCHIQAQWAASYHEDFDNWLGHIK